jgi:hypothetical protein
MICPKCGFRGHIEYPVCPICGFMISKPRSKILLVLLRLSDWVLDRRLAIVTKRQQIDTKPNRFNFFRVWWVYYLFDIIPIVKFQDPMSLFIKEPIGVPNEPPKNNSSVKGNEKWN